MQANSCSHSSEPDEHALEKAIRQAALEVLRLETLRALAESRQALAAHGAARARMADALQEARARLAFARPRTLAQESVESVSMDLLTFHKSPHPQVALPLLPHTGER